MRALRWWAVVGRIERRRQQRGLRAVEDDVARGERTLAADVAADLFRKRPISIT